MSESECNVCMEVTESEGEVVLFRLFFVFLLFVSVSLLFSSLSWSMSESECGMCIGVGKLFIVV